MDNTALRAEGVVPYAELVRKGGLGAKYPKIIFLLIQSRRYLLQYQKARHTLQTPP